MGSVAGQDYLKSLNNAQRQAVEHDPKIPLQILAGPGSGKTKVLTSRIVHLITRHSLQPRSICAVTFTKKAANEMKERLTTMIGKEKTAQVRMGTFHALCALYIRKYAVHVGIKGNFTVCDTDEGKKILSGFLKERKALLVEKKIDLSPGNLQSKISQYKAKGYTAEDLLVMFPVFHPEETNVVLIMDRLIAEFYKSYQETLRANNSLDFDDLLIVGLMLFKTHEVSVRWCKHILVDEFQDTNFTQYELMRALGVAKCVTIVGDPDQSIYGWRSADVANLSKMQKDFPGTHQIFLEQNYRSTASILKVSLAIVSQDKTRIPKMLHTAHPSGVTPILRTCETEHHEASFIAMEIKRVIAHMGGTLRWGDFVILLRFNALSRSIESALQKEGIPSRILGGHKFFDRLEINDILSYLQLVDNPRFGPAFQRAVNVPSRGIGEKSLSEIFSKADELGLNAMELVERIHDGEVPDIKPAVKRKLHGFVTTIRKLREQAKNETMPSSLIRALLKLVRYEEHLRKTQPDWDVRWENVRELITFASDVQGSMLTDVNLPDGDNDENDDTPLRLFLQASMLSSEGDSESEEENKDKVTISTCHAAKGLEWPVVIVPSVEDGTFPFHRAEDVDEERRLLYVACTRAKGLLYLTRVLKRKIAGNIMDRDLSFFICDVIEKDQKLLTWENLCLFSQSQRATLSVLLQRPEPADDHVKTKVDAFYQSIRNRQVFGHDFNGISGAVDLLPQPQVHAGNFVAAFVPVRQLQLDIKPNVLQDRQNHPAFKRETEDTFFVKAEDRDVKPTLNSRVSIKQPSSSSASVKQTAKKRPVEKFPSDVKPMIQHDTPSTSRQTVARSRKVERVSSVVDLTFSSPPRASRPLKQESSDLMLIDPPPVVATTKAKKSVKKEPSLLDLTSSPPPVKKEKTQKPRMPPTKPPLGAIAEDPPNPLAVSPASTVTVMNPSTKRRLGMGRGGTGYANKKFKLPT